MEEKPNETLEERNIRVANELEERAEKDKVTEAHETMSNVGEALSVREQLLKRTRLRIFKTPIDIINEEGDVTGEIEIKTRLMTGSERERAIILIKELEVQSKEETRDILKFNETTRMIAEVLVEVCVDEDVRHYFREGEATDDVLIAVLSSTMEQSLEAIGDNVQRFREKRDRPSPT